jgi:hypothetical protein
MTKMKFDVAIEHIRIVLRMPATSWKEVAERVSERVGRKVTVSAIADAVSHLRQNHETFGWNVMHIGAGGVSGDGRDEGRIFRLGVNAEAISDEQREHMKRGSLALLRETFTKNANQAEMLVMVAEIVRSPAARRKLLEQVILVKAANRHVEMLIEDMEGEVAA